VPPRRVVGDSDREPEMNRRGPRLSRDSRVAYSVDPSIVPEEVPPMDEVRTLEALNPATDPTAAMMRELVAHLRQNRAQLREEWVRRIAETKLLQAMTRDEIFAEATSVYDSYVEALETRTLEALQAYAQNLSERIIPRGVETHEVVGIVLLLRDVLAR